MAPRGKPRGGLAGGQVPVVAWRGGEVPVVAWWAGRSPWWAGGEGAGPRGGLEGRAGPRGGLGLEAAACFFAGAAAFAALVADLVGEWLVGGKVANVAQGGLGDAGQGLLGKEGLMGGDQHVGEG